MGEDALETLRTAIRGILRENKIEASVSVRAEGQALTVGLPGRAHFLDPMWRLFGYPTKGASALEVSQLLLKVLPQTLPGASSEALPKNPSHPNVHGIVVSMGGPKA